MTALSSVPRDTQQEAVVSDREATADLVLGVAVADVVTRLRDLRHTSEAYRVARATHLLQAAGSSAERILGRTA